MTDKSKAYDGDYTDPAKSKAVDASYDKDYLTRRAQMEERMKRVVQDKRKGKGT